MGLKWAAQVVLVRSFYEILGPDDKIRAFNQGWAISVNNELFGGQRIFVVQESKALSSRTMNPRLDKNYKINNTTTKVEQQETPHTTTMSPKERSIKMSLEAYTMSSSSTSSTKTTPSISAATTPSTAPTTPTIEEERQLGAALPVTKPQSPTAPATTAQASRTTPGAHRHPLSPLEREYDPSRDDLPIDELLARPRLPRSPYESHRKHVINGRTMKPLKAAATRASRAGGGDARQGREMEKEKEWLRALGVEMSELKLPKKNN